MDTKKVNRIALARLIKLVAEIPTEEGPVLFIEGDTTIDNEVFVADEEGNMIPAPDGTYTAKDGRLITVTAGKITGIEEPTPEPVAEEPAAEETVEAEEEPQEEPAEAPAEEEPKEDETEALKARIAELEEENAKLKAELEEWKAKAETPAAETLEEEEKKENLSEQKPENTILKRIRSRQ